MIVEVELSESDDESDMDKMKDEEEDNVFNNLENMLQP